MKHFPYQVVSALAACLATFCLTVAASGPVVTAAQLVVGAGA